MNPLAHNPLPDNRPAENRAVKRARAAVERRTRAAVDRRLHGDLWTEQVNALGPDPSEADAERPRDAWKSRAPQNETESERLVRRRAERAQHDAAMEAYGRFTEETLARYLGQQDLFRRLDAQTALAERACAPRARPALTVRRGRNARTPRRRAASKRVRSARARPSPDPGPEPPRARSLAGGAW